MVFELNAEMPIFRANFPFWRVFEFRRSLHGFSWPVTCCLAAKMKALGETFDDLSNVERKGQSLAVPFVFLCLGRGNENVRCFPQDG